MPRFSTTIGGLLICISAALWGLDGVVLTPRLSNIQVPFVVFLLHAVPFALMQPLLGRSYGALRTMNRTAWWSLFLVALTGGLVGTIAIVNALFLVEFQRLSVVVLLQKLQPVFAISLAAVVLRERPTRDFLLWTVVAIGGAYLLTFGAARPDLSTDSVTAQAAAWALLAAASFGAATVFSKRLLASLSFTEATFARYGMTTVLALAYLLASGIGLPFSEVTPRNWVIILIIALTTGSGAIFLYYLGLSRVRAGVAAICELCLPLSAVILDYLINDSLLDTWQWVGAAVLIAAIMKITVRSEK
jgi:drug/metabolite transporter (DMT)-like permease